MINNELANYCINSLKEAGIDKAEFYLEKSKRYELNVVGEELSLLRTTFDTNVNITAIKEGKKGVISLNKTDENALQDALKSVIDICDNSEADAANDISPMQPAKSFKCGGDEPDLDKMYLRLKNFLAAVKEAYPKINLLDSFLDFTHRCDYYANSNGARLSSAKGNYNFQVTFAAKDGEKSSSFNYSGFSANDIDRELLECSSFNTLLKQSVEQLDTKPLEGKFTGDVIITPECLGDMIEMYLDVYLSDTALIAGTSALKDKINQMVACEKLTLHSNPVSDEISDGYFITKDGFEAQNITIIDKGMLKTFMLNLYGANKTSKDRALNSGGAYVVESGDKSFDEIVKSIKKGMLVARFSGGNPSRSGDFSGVAKNSYYVEDGEIKYPVSETMISGNLYEMFNNIIDISKERVDFGNAILPWIAASGIIISGK
ncbi:MAG: TldD [Clostridiales bacterium]|nr:TldD [Clostridiales bacterium]